MGSIENQILFKIIFDEENVENLHEFLKNSGNFLFLKGISILQVLPLDLGLIEKIIFQESVYIKLINCFQSKDENVINEIITFFSFLSVKTFHDFKEKVF